MNPFAATGRLTLSFLRETGRLSGFIFRALRVLACRPLYWKPFAGALARIGFSSLPVVGLTAIFTGAALALNVYDGSLRFNAETFLPQILGVSIVRELGPVLAALMVAGRCSSAMAAEIGSMRVTEQIDAMATLSVDPFRYIIGPNILAATLSLPLLVLIADIIGIFGGYLVSVNILDFSGHVFIRNILDFIEPRDVYSGLVKASIFGFLIAVMGCYAGYYSRGGARGVGASTRTAVVTAAIAILASNYVMTSQLVRI